jgi:hypothetical protein
MDSNPLPRAGILAVAFLTGVACFLGAGIVLIAALGPTTSTTACAATQTVGATEYGGPGDPSSGTRGSSGANLLTHPDSYAELGGTSFQTATALGRLPYGTPLVISSGHRTLVAYKRDIGLGGGPIDGHPRVIDLWWQLARRLGIPYEHGRWSGTVQISVVSPACGAGEGAGLQLVPCQTAKRRRQPAPLPRSPGSSPPATRSPASRTFTAAATICRSIRSRRVTTAPRASLTCSGAAVC